MLIYKRNLKVTQDDFTNKQEEIKNAIRQLVDGYLKNFNEQNFPSTKVDFAIPMSDELKTKYHFLFTQTAPIEKTFAELIGMNYSTFRSKLSRDTFTATETLRILDICGYKVSIIPK